MPGPRPPPKKRLLLQESLKAFAHWKKHGDYTAIIKLADHHGGYRTHDAVISWFERVTGFRWDKRVSRFVGKDRSVALAVDEAAKIPIWSERKSIEEAVRAAPRFPVQSI